MKVTNTPTPAKDVRPGQWVIHSNQLTQVTRATGQVFFDPHAEIRIYTEDLGVLHYFPTNTITVVTFEELS